TVVAAAAQTSGRGRLGRSWHSPPGLGVYVSVVLRPGVPLEQIPRFTIAAAVAAAEACRATAGCEIAVQWPNDLVAAGRKLGGILGELRAPAGSAPELVLGAGINVLHGVEDFPPELAERATSLRLIAGRGMLDPERLAAAYIRGLAAESERLELGEWAALVARWERWAPQARGYRVRVRAASAYTGETAGLDAHGGLCVRRSDGRTTTVRWADAVEYLEG
ncbi:MAG TPA: biotin--[acetyl-CoA-carboxylase] ligase, partial [Candidatus Polarisedimenticolaceae bacterium]|nr:biotin--[acetyl-CoA-carboxylase] ligase [Candidatus Polarisedimenticolaceae bacterium]